MGEGEREEGRERQSDIQSHADEEGCRGQHTNIHLRYTYSHRSGGCTRANLSLWGSRVFACRTMQFPESNSAKTRMLTHLHVSPEWQNLREMVCGCVWAGRNPIGSSFQPPTGWDGANTYPPSTTLLRRFEICSGGFWFGRRASRSSSTLQGFLDH